MNNLNEIMQIYNEFTKVGKGHPRRLILAEVLAYRVPELIQQLTGVPEDPAHFAYKAMSLKIGTEIQPIKKEYSC